MATMDTTMAHREVASARLCERLRIALRKSGFEELVAEEDAQATQQDNSDVVLAFAVGTLLAVTHGFLVARELQLGYWAYVVAPVVALVVIMTIIGATPDWLGVLFFFALCATWVATLILELVWGDPRATLLTHVAPLLSLLVIWMLWRIPVNLGHLLGTLVRTNLHQLSRRPGVTSSVVGFQYGVLAAMAITFGLLLVRRPEMWVWDHVPDLGDWAYVAAPVAIFVGLVLTGLFIGTRESLGAAFMPALYAAWVVTLIREVSTAGARSAAITHGIPVLVVSGVFMLMRPSLLKSISLLVPVALVVLFLPLFSAELWTAVAAIDVKHVLWFAAVTILPLSIFLRDRMLGSIPRIFEDATTELRRSPQDEGRARDRALRELHTLEQGALRGETTRARTIGGRLISALAPDAASYDAYDSDLLAKSFSSGATYKYSAHICEQIQRSLKWQTDLRLITGTLGIFAIFLCYIYLLAMLVLSATTVEGWTRSKVPIHTVAIGEFSVRLLGGPFIWVAVVLGLVATAVFFAFVLTQDEFSRAFTETLLHGRIERCLLFAIPYFYLRMGSNDDFESADTLEGPGGSVTGSNLFASKEPGEPDHAGNAGGRSVWYRWKAPQGGKVAVDTAGSSFDTLLAVYRGATIDGLLPIVASDGCQVGQGLVTFPATRGVEYMVAVDGLDGATGDIVLNWRIQGTPANDEFAAAEPISGSRGVVRGDNRTATREPGEPDHAGDAGGRSVWYRWTAPQSEMVTIDTVGSSFDTLLAVYQGTALDALTEVATTDDHGTRRLVTFHAEEGVEYRIAVDGFEDAAGNLVLYWSVG